MLYLAVQYVQGPKHIDVPGPCDQDLPHPTHTHRLPRLSKYLQLFFKRSWS